jgi:hypothetical protein
LCFAAEPRVEVWFREIPRKTFLGGLPCLGPDISMKRKKQKQMIQFVYYTQLNQTFYIVQNCTILYSCAMREMYAFISAYDWHTIYSRFKLDKRIKCVILTKYLGHNLQYSYLEMLLHHMDYIFLTFIWFSRLWKINNLRLEIGLLKFG